jgi:hypothetical protein
MVPTRSRNPASARPLRRACLAAFLCTTLATASSAIAAIENPAESDFALVDRSPFPRLAPEEPPYQDTMLLAEASEIGAGAQPLLAPIELYSHPAAPRSYGSMFLKAWVPMTGVEFTLLAVTASLPKSWTGWSAHFVRDGINHFERAYTQPPHMDNDWWFHNYVGHPIGGSLYYNAVRSQGATPHQSTFFAFVLSMQWEYFFEAFAERPSIQDIIVTPVAGTVLGELSHRLTMHLKKGGTNFGEKILILITNPMHAAFAGF